MDNFQTNNEMEKKYHIPLTIVYIATVRLHSTAYIKITQDQHMKLGLSIYCIACNKHCQCLTPQLLDGANTFTMIIIASYMSTRGHQRSHVRPVSQTGLDKAETSDIIKNTIADIQHIAHGNKMHVNVGDGGNASPDIISLRVKPRTICCCLSGIQGEVDGY